MQGIHKLQVEAPIRTVLESCVGCQENKRVVTRNIVISMLASFVAGGAIVWFADRPAADSETRMPGPATPTLFDQRPFSASGVQVADAVATAPFDPATALEVGLALPNQRTKQAAVRRIAEAAARLGPTQGIELAGAIDDAGIRSAFVAALCLEWARTDAGGFLADLPSVQTNTESLLQLASQSPLMGALRLASEADPVYAFEVGEQYRGAQGVLVRSAALEALASQNPAAALQRYPEVLAGEEGELLLQSIATGYARADLDEAVKWLSTLDTTGGSAFWPVIEAVALVDLLAAIELDAEAMELGYGGSNYGDLAWLRIGLRSGSADVVQVADQLWLTKSKALLADTLSWWAGDDPYGTIAWIHTKDTISSLAIGRIAGSIAGRDLALALNLGDQFSPAVRSVWLEQALGQAASFDPIGVLNRLASFRDEPFYDVALANVINRARTSLSPPVLAELVGDAPPSQSARQIGSDWAKIDPIGALNWALPLSTYARQSAVEGVISEWQSSDPSAALSWVRNQTEVEIQERVIMNLCRRTLACADR